MLWESWTVLALFVVNLVFFVVMSFVSPYYKKITSEGLGRAMNIAWMIVVIIVGAFLMFYNVQCSLSGTQRGKAPRGEAGKLAINVNEATCGSLVYVTVAVLGCSTLAIIIWSIVNDIRYRKKLAAGTVKQESYKWI